MYSGDQSVNASYSSAVHIDGAAPFGPGLAPLMSHWFADVVPYYWCCAWTDSFTTCRNNYANRRTTPDCDNYDPPSVGKVQLKTEGTKLPQKSFLPLQMIHHCFTSTNIFQGGSYGDPHMITLDALQYTFNGAGEFWMVRTNDTELPDSENINIQGRMEQIGKIGQPIPNNSLPIGFLIALNNRFCMSAIEFNKIPKKLTST